MVGLDMPFFTAADQPVTALHPGPHVDQNTSIVGGRRYQSILYAWPANENSSTTVVLPGSHLDLYNNLLQETKWPTDKHFVCLDSLSGQSAIVAKAAWKANARRVILPAGALLLWDSRMLHAGWIGGARLAQPVCWEPKAARTEEALQRKMTFCLKGLSTSHSAVDGELHSVNGKDPVPLPITRIPSPIKGVSECSVRSSIITFPLLKHGDTKLAWSCEQPELLLNQRIFKFL